MSPATARSVKRAKPAETHLVDELDDTVHWTDVLSALRNEAMPIVARTSGKTGLYPGIAAEPLLNELIDYFADRRSALEAYAAMRDRQNSAEHAARTDELGPQSWLETDRAREGLLGCRVQDIIDEADKIPRERRVHTLGPLLGWGEAHGLEWEKLDALRSVIDMTPGQIELEMVLDSVSPGDEFDFNDPDSELADLLHGRRVRVIGFGATPGTVRLMPIGPWQSDPDEREPIGGEGMTSSFMGAANPPR